MGISKRIGWTYSRVLLLSDCALIALAFGSAYVFRFGLTENFFLISPISERAFFASYFFGLLFTAIVLLIFLNILGTRNSRITGVGPEEYSLVAQANLLSFALVIIITFTTNAGFSRTLLFSAFFFSTFGMIFSRWLMRRGLRNRRKLRKNLTPAILVGKFESIQNSIADFQYRYEAGFKIVGALYTDNGLLSQQKIESSFNIHLEKFNIKKFRDFLNYTEALNVFIVDLHQLDDQMIQDISWELNPEVESLIISPQMLSLTGPRIHARPVAGLPFIYVEVPSFHGFQRALKRAVDIIGSICFILLFSPIIVIVSILIFVDSPGAIFFTQERVGLQGSIFKMIKFRTMVNDAEILLADLEIQNDMTHSPLFKLREDPRVTKVGKHLRRYSVDELPQLLNVLWGQMSLVGPRPPLQSEVNKYEEKVLRKFLVKPGMTGLWQISGRSNLSWEDSVKLDLYYVENWSVLTDLIILARTAKAVFMKNGAY